MEGEGIAGRHTEVGPRQFPLHAEPAGQSPEPGIVGLPLRGEAVGGAGRRVTIGVPAAVHHVVAADIERVVDAEVELDEAVVSLPSRDDDGLVLFHQTVVVDVGVVDEPLRVVLGGDAPREGLHTIPVPRLGEAEEIAAGALDGGVAVGLGIIERALPVVAAVARVVVAVRQQVGPVTEVAVDDDGVAGPVSSVLVAADAVHGHGVEEVVTQGAGAPGERDGDPVVVGAVGVGRAVEVAGIGLDNHVVAVGQRGEPVVAVVVGDRARLHRAVAGVTVAVGVGVDLDRDVPEA